MDKTLSEKIAVMQAFERGEKIEYRLKVVNFWLPVQNPDWDWRGCDYRVKEIKKDSIDWSQVRDEFICHAFDENDRGNFYKVKPKVDYGFNWWHTDGYYVSSEAFKSVIRGDTPWDKSLVFRPGFA